MKRTVKFKGRVTSIDEDKLTLVGKCFDELQIITLLNKNGFNDDFKSEFKIGDFVIYDLVVTMERISEDS